MYAIASRAYGHAPDGEAALALCGRELASCKVMRILCDTILIFKHITRGAQSGKPKSGGNLVRRMCVRCEIFSLLWRIL